MRSRLAWAALSLTLSVQAGAFSQPDQALTPGAVDATAVVAKLCTPGYTAKIRLVTEATKRKVIASYKAAHADWPPPPYEIDHFISLEIGGLNAQANLWPQPMPEARRKDVVETALHRLVCQGKITLPEAQTRIRTWWQDPTFSARKAQR